MEPIYSMTTLQRNPLAVKDAAREGVVRVAEQGAPAFVFCSDEAFELAACMRSRHAQT